jgi:glycosyltransferase involved in cell wall biosynthesis
LSEPDVSVVIPAWGGYAGTPLEEALASIREQDAPVQVIVVDNASDEPLGAVGDAELMRSPERLTVGAARNLGLERVATPYVLFWDADDLMLPGTIAFLRDHLRARPELVAVAAGVTEGDSARRHRWPPRWSGRLAGYPRLFAFCHAVWSLFPSTGATIMRTEAVRAAGGYATDIDAGGDWVLGVSLAFRGRVELAERPGRVYRRLGGSLWQENRAPAKQLARAASVRARLREDPAIPGWARASTPALRILHPTVLLGLAPIARGLRSLIRSGHRLRNR